jgi:hypothetical protein
MPVQQKLQKMVSNHKGIRLPAGKGLEGAQMENRFSGLDGLPQHEQDRILKEVQQQINDIELKAKRDIIRNREHQCSVAVREALDKAGAITYQQRIDIITRVRRQHGLSPFEEQV